MFAQDGGTNGTLITLSNELKPTVVAEVRERGVAWLCQQTGTAQRWRGQEFVVWGISDAGNYDNIIEYSFRDDGGMSFRMGNTGYNDQKNKMSNVAHTHNGLWRVDIDLNGGTNNSALWVQHTEPAVPDNPNPILDSLQAADPELLFNNVHGMNVEGGRRWIDTPAPFLPQFTALLIEDATANAFGHHFGYEFTPLQAGTSRHYGPLEAWTFDDVYVTVYHPNELDWTIDGHWTEPDNYLLQYLKDEEPVTNNDLVVWVNASAHHDPADEDRSLTDVGTNNITGVTLVHWSGFNLEPHNLFDANPLGAPFRCGL